MGFNEKKNNPVENLIHFDLLLTKQLLTKQ